MQWYRQFFANPVWTEALGNSLLIAALTAALSVTTAIATAMALVRHHFRWKSACERALLLPMVLPAVALAAGMLAAVRLTPLWGSHLSTRAGSLGVGNSCGYLVLRLR